MYFVLWFDWGIHCNADSNLQTFPPSATQGKISGGNNPPRDADGNLPFRFGWDFVEFCSSLVLRSWLRNVGCAYLFINFFMLSWLFSASLCNFVCLRAYIVNFRSAADTFSRPVNGTDEPQSGGWLHRFTVGAYKPYFDVDTSDVVERLKESLFPFRGTFTEKTANNPDL